MQEYWKPVSANCIAWVISWSQTIYIYIYIHTYIWKKETLYPISTGFSQIFISPPPTPTKQQFSSYNPIKTAFLAVVITLAPFLFWFHTLWTYRSSLFSFWLMLRIHRRLFLALKEVQVFKITSPQVPFTRWKNPPQ